MHKVNFQVIFFTTNDSVYTKFSLCKFLRSQNGRDLPYVVNLGWFLQQLGVHCAWDFLRRVNKKKFIIDSTIDEYGPWSWIWIPMDDVCQLSKERERGQLCQIVQSVSKWPFFSLTENEKKNCLLIDLKSTHYRFN